MKSYASIVSDYNKTIDESNNKFAKYSSNKCVYSQHFPPLTEDKENIIITLHHNDEVNTNHNIMIHNNNNNMVTNDNNINSSSGSNVMPVILNANNNDNFNKLSSNATYCINNSSSKSPEDICTTSLLDMVIFNDDVDCFESLKQQKNLFINTVCCSNNEVVGDENNITSNTTILSLSNKQEKNPWILCDNNNNDNSNIENMNRGHIHPFSDKSNYSSYNNSNNGINRHNENYNAQKQHRDDSIRIAKKQEEKDSKLLFPSSPTTDNNKTWMQQFHNNTNDDTIIFKKKEDVDDKWQLLNEHEQEEELLSYRQNQYDNSNNWEDDKENNHNNDCDWNHTNMIHNNDNQLFMKKNQKPFELFQKVNIISYDDWDKWYDNFLGNCNVVELFDNTNNNNQSSVSPSTNHFRIMNDDHYYYENMYHIRTNMIIQSLELDNNKEIEEEMMTVVFSNTTTTNSTITTTTTISVDDINIVDNIISPYKPICPFFPNHSKNNGKRKHYESLYDSHF